MRLIRLATTDTSAEFDNFFNTDILIPPKSKIALQNISFELNTGFYSTTAGNQTITYKFHEKDVVKTATLPIKQCELSQLHTLLKDMEVALNNALFSVGRGVQWFVETQGDGIHIQCKVMLFANQPVLDTNLFATQNIPLKSINIAAAVPSGTLPTGNTRYIAYNNKWSRGTPSFYTQIYNNANTAGVKNFRMCLLSTNARSSMKQEILDTDIAFAIECRRSGENYYVKTPAHEDFQETATNPKATNAVSGAISADNYLTNDVVQMNIMQGIVKGTVTQKKDGTNGFGDPIVLFECPYANEDLCPVLIFFGSMGGNTSINHTQTLVTLDNVLLTDLDSDHNNPPHTPQDQNITLPKPLAKSLGFTNSMQNFSQVKFINFIGDVSIAFLEEAFIVMLRDLKCESFDGLVNKRSNIIAVVSANPSSSGQVNYEVANLVFIDLNNAQPLTIRNLKARVLTNDLQPIAVSGSSTMTLLLDS